MTDPLLLMPLLGLAFILAAVALLAWGRRQITKAPTYEEGLDAGIQLGLQQALRTVRGYPKPYITMSEERGWVHARSQLSQALAEQIDGDLD